MVRKYTIKPSDVFVKITDIGRVNKPTRKGSTSKFKIAYSTIEKKGGEHSDFKCIVCVDPTDGGAIRSRMAVTSTEIYVISPHDFFSNEYGSDLVNINHRAVVDFIRCPRDDTRFRYVSRKFIRQLRKVGIPYKEVMSDFEMSDSWI